MIAKLTAAKAIPTVEWLASPRPTSEHIESMDTNAARPKNENAMIRSATFSRASGSRAENCHATAAAEDTSITESNPNPISAVEDTRVPSPRATTASTRL
jgi:hypothetical protein